MRIYFFNSDLDRKSEIEASNLRAFQEFQSGLIEEVKDLDVGLSSFRASSIDFMDTLGKKISEFQQCYETVS
jgi:hypothetical protein